MHWPLEQLNFLKFHSKQPQVNLNNCKHLLGNRIPLIHGNMSLVLMLPHRRRPTLLTRRAHPAERRLPSPVRLIAGGTLTRTPPTLLPQHIDPSKKHPEHPVH